MLRQIFHWHMSLWVHHVSSALWEQWCHWCVCATWASGLWTIGSYTQMSPLLHWNVVESSETFVSPSREIIQDMNACHALEDGPFPYSLDLLPYDVLCSVPLGKHWLKLEEEGFKAWSSGSSRGTRSSFWTACASVVLPSSVRMGSVTNVVCSGTFAVVQSAY